MKLNLWATGAAVIFFLMSVELFNLYREQHARGERLTIDLKISRDSCKYFKGRDGSAAVTIQQQEFTIKELKRIHPEIISAGSNLYIPPRLLLGYSQAASTGRAEIRAALHDTIYTDKTETTAAKAIKYRSPFYDVSGLILKDTARLSITSRDTIEYFNQRGRRARPWLWILSKRNSDVVTITNKNRDNKITILQAVKIIK
jgi:hypothetical protein